MRGRTGLLGLLGLVSAACAGAPAAPPALAYRLPTDTELVYAVADTGAITIEALGQGLTMDVGSAALYSVDLGRADDGITVTVGIDDLDATVNVPIAGPVSFDESSVEGSLVFTLDRRGEVALVSAPELDEAARQIVPMEAMAHSFFPALPGVAVAVGDTWTDTVSVSGAQGGGTETVLRYTLAGDTLVAGASLLHIRFEGTSVLTQSLSMQGMQLEQTTQLAIEGHVLWDLGRALLVERVSNARGTGTVRTAMLPGELPTRFEMMSRARLQPE